MEWSGYLLYPIAVIIVLWMWSRVRGMSIEQIVNHSERQHHELTAIFEEHPKGGDWRLFQTWVENSATSQRPSQHS